ncbi:hypothetical protein AN218_22585 [Streptomyces nanshensis]|uniref:Uncharacterized protein n=1 Tax=Streptomyces nanshensis TaxID=518642 RepID=A0A1E7KZA3_9ACTN|nr:hypothetical protein AN218_22585 [Streptomyces nanshensis]
MNGPGTCADCRQRVIFTRTEKGKTLAVDPTPDRKGNTAIRRDGLGAYVSRRPSKDLPLWGDERLHMPHPATCEAQQRARATPLAGVVVLDEYRRRRSRF